MDDLDRLAFRVARTVRATYPHLLERGFTLADLEERLAPFADTRRELAEGGPSGYETTLLRLLAGERGYVGADDAMQAACRDALRHASPTLSMVRTWTRNTLTLRNGAFALASGDVGAEGGMPTAPVACEPSGDDCTYCGGGLPIGRRIRFCPHCGLDLTVRQCPACSTELDREWRFCVTCGRQADDESSAVAASRYADAGTGLAAPSSEHLA